VLFFILKTLFWDNLVAQKTDTHQFFIY